MRPRNAPKSLSELLCVCVSARECVRCNTVRDQWVCVAHRELFFILFHHSTREEWKAENTFRTQTANCFFGEQYFSPSYVKRADIQLFREPERQETDADSGEVGNDCIAPFYFQRHIQ